MSDFALMAFCRHPLITSSLETVLFAMRRHAQTPAEILSEPPGKQSQLGRLRGLGTSRRIFVSFRPISGTVPRGKVRSDRKLREQCEKCLFMVEPVQFRELYQLRRNRTATHCCGWTSAAHCDVFNIVMCLLTRSQ